VREVIDPALYGVRVSTHFDAPHVPPNSSSLAVLNSQASIARVSQQGLRLAF
jgi:hypothetical protein